MLTAKENMREVVRGGNPDRLVNQYEALSLLIHPAMMASPLLKKGDPDMVNAWGVTFSFPANVPGQSYHDPPCTIVCLLIRSIKGRGYGCQAVIREQHQIKIFKKCVSHLRALCIPYMQAETQPAQRKKIKKQDIDN